MIRFLLVLTLLLRPALAQEARPHVTHAVLVHGIWESGKYTFTDLRKQLEASGVECLVPSLRPATAHNGLMPLAEQLKSEIDDAFGPDQEFLMIGFSMGGIVSRAYLQSLEGASRCQALVTISSPHQGTRTAFLHPGEGTRQMRPDSPFLRKLAQTEDVLGDLPVVTYRTPMDLVIVPSRNAEWDRAENVVVRCPLHALMSDSDQVRADLFTRFEFPRVAPPIKTRTVMGPPHRR
ncbi:esterase/lipase family protein [Haloferula rosea]|uniref:Alpha/beta fold hydrolase n=1 Tax=Haloferula rosea TaxID=490093 RepID=A0A934RBZ1_9BACT|nr:alpha/beta fold hydrolase [Haloferula rosea]MBK1825816.1 alpha/beta fold hydrolase [Haloferula rosea]